ncbi:hypothetical protein [Nitratireductor luteus]|uniref:hypothetical protein n=1 Tax=Nitratireductor luteus TaxID=2976980 RepID=UPI00223F29E0|nr:hypothetical protein [Nitratireductor luteus]
MTIYATGTVSVTAGSAIVTGDGTAWDLFLITGGLFSSQGISIPILQVNSDTELVLGYNWPGTTDTGRIYAIDRQSAAAASAIEANDRLAQIVKRLEALSYVDFDAVGSLAERVTYDGEPLGFKFLQIDVDPFELWVKASNTSGDWAGPNAYGQGPTGDTGPKGDAATVTVGSTTTLAPGQPANVTNSGTNAAAVLEFEIPQGAKGDAGWAAETELVADGAARTVVRIADFIGGEGTKPPGIGMYIGPGGYVLTAAEAINVKGAEGPQGPVGVGWKGAWDPGATYAVGDLVTDPDALDDTAVWIAIAPSTNAKPRDSATEWSLFPGSFNIPRDYGLITEAATETRDYGTIA